MPSSTYSPSSVRRAMPDNSERRATLSISWWISWTRKKLKPCLTRRAAQRVSLFPPTSTFSSATLTPTATARSRPMKRAAWQRTSKVTIFLPIWCGFRLVNLYLHGFTDPHVYEYDTLTSEERWNEYADVILANPPFMSPKGGIKPHKRFSIQAKRSEVLFVDYMAEHLTPAGRAGIIVPEGIIFQSQGAYKDLRKILVENSLVAVVSLPAGCFNPYSGVKTSILFLDKSLARRSKTVAFFRVDNDGFGLGAQRRAFSKNDLPRVTAELKAYIDCLRLQEPTESSSRTHGLVVPRESIAATTDYSLSAERYRKSDVSNTSFPKVRLGDVCERIMDGTHFSPKSTEKGEYRYITAKNIKEWGLSLDDVTFVSKSDHDEIYRRCPVRRGDVLYIKDGATTGVATINPLEEEFSLLSSVAVLRGKEGVLDNRFLARYLNSPIGKSHMLGMVSGVAITRLTLTKLNAAEIPLPPLDVQLEIVDEIERYQKVINGARSVVGSYEPHIPIHPEWPIVELGDVCDAILTGPFGTALHQSDYVQNGIPVINPQNIADGEIRSEGAKMVSSDTRDRMAEFCIRDRDIVIGRRGEMGRCAVATAEMDGWLCGTGCFVIRLRPNCDVKFAFFQISSARVKAYPKSKRLE